MRKLKTEKTQTSHDIKTVNCTLVFFLSLSSNIKGPTCIRLACAHPQGFPGNLVCLIHFIQLHSYSKIQFTFFNAFFWGGGLFRTILRELNFLEN